ncbi:MAG: 2-amino-4-hydroxy-6-hydroxymethyldihydropteridine diphosphokinase [Spirochaetota bacterium]
MNIREAVRRIGTLADVTPLRVSSLYRSERLGDAATTDFHNAAMTILTEISPDALLTALNAIEHELGRVRTVRWGDRTIDIDIILFGDIRMDTPRLTIPHPGFRTRPFVLLPSIEIDPTFHDIDGTPFTELLQHAVGRCERLEGTSPPLF